MNYAWRWEGDVLLTDGIAIPILPGRDRDACEAVARALDAAHAALQAGRAADGTVLRKDADMTDMTDLATLDYQQATLFAEQLPDHPGQIMRYVAAGLAATTARTLEERAARIITIGRRAILDIGIELAAARDEAQRGTWGAFLARCGIEERSAQNYIRVATRFRDKPEVIAALPSAALYALAAPSVDAVLAEQVVVEVERGELPPTVAAVKERLKPEKPEKFSATAPVVEFPRLLTPQAVHGAIDELLRAGWHVRPDPIVDEQWVIGPTPTGELLECDWEAIVLAGPIVARDPAISIDDLMAAIEAVAVPVAHDPADLPPDYASVSTRLLRHGWILEAQKTEAGFSYTTRQEGRPGNTFYTTWEAVQRAADAADHTTVATRPELLGLPAATLDHLTARGITPIGERQDESGETLYRVRLVHHGRERELEKSLAGLHALIQQRPLTADLETLSQAGWDQFGEPFPRAGAMVYRFRYAGREDDEREVAAGEIECWAADERVRTHGRSTAGQAALSAPPAAPIAAGGSARQDRPAAPVSAPHGARRTALDMLPEAQRQAAIYAQELAFAITDSDWSMISHIGSALVQLADAQLTPPAAPDEPATVAIVVALDQIGARINAGAYDGGDGAALVAMEAQLAALAEELDDAAYEALAARRTELLTAWRELGEAVYP